MSTTELIIAEKFCTCHEIDLSFIHSLHESGLIEVVTMEQKVFIPEEQLPQLERMLHFYEMGINIEGIEAVSHLLQQMETMKEQLRLLNNQLHATL